jgi:hypothetical protein
VVSVCSSALSEDEWGVWGQHPTNQTLFAPIHLVYLLSELVSEIKKVLVAASFTLVGFK